MKNRMDLFCDLFTGGSACDAIMKFGALAGGKPVLLIGAVKAAGSIGDFDSAEGANEMKAASCLGLESTEAHSMIKDFPYSEKQRGWISPFAKRYPF